LDAGRRIAGFTPSDFTPDVDLREIARQARVAICQSWFLASAARKLPLDDEVKATFTEQLRTGRAEFSGSRVAQVVLTMI
jgi:hypothetical protein